MTLDTINVVPFGVQKIKAPQLNDNQENTSPTTRGNSSSGDAEVSRVTADDHLKNAYLLTQQGRRIQVPAESTLGRWVEMLRSIVNSSAFQELEKHFGGKGAFSHVDWRSGEIWFDGGSNKINRESPVVDSIAGGKDVFDSLMVIAKKMAPHGNFARGDVFQIGNYDGRSVDRSIVQNFYSARISDSSPVDHVLDEIKSNVGEVQTRRNLLSGLKGLVEASGIKPDLEHVLVEIAPHSVFWSEQQPQPVTMNLKQLMAAYGLNIPTTPQELANLERVLFAPSLTAPSAGDYGGLLTKDVPLSIEAQKKIIETVDAWKSSQIQVPKDERGNFQTLFQYLARAVPESLRGLSNTDPEGFLKALIDTPQARALGQQLQEAIGSLPTQTSGQEALLVALRLETIPPSVGVDRNNLAGYNLRQQDNVGRSPAEIVKRFEAHMEGIVGPEMAKVAAYQLLASSSPEFLVKGMPDSLVYGSPQWAVFSAEVSRREQDTPGSTAGVSYLQVRERGSLEPVTKEQEYQSHIAVVQSAIDWGIANGIIKESTEGYSEKTIEKAATALQEQVVQMASAIKGIITPVPTRRDLAITELTRVFGEKYAHLFEKKILRYHQRELHDDTSLLDAYMSGTLNYRLYSNSSELPNKLLLGAFGELPEIKAEFEKKFELYNEEFSRSSGLMFKYQLSQLPDEDRMRFEFGNVEMIHLSGTKNSGFPENSEENPIVKLFGAGAVLIKTVHNGQAVEYVYSPMLGRIIKNGEPLPGVPEGWSAGDKRSVFSGRDQLNSKTPLYGVRIGEKTYSLRRIWARSGAGALPEPHILAQNKTSSERASDLASQMSQLYKHAADNIKDSAYGMSDSEQRKAKRDVIKNFVLSLIPFHDFVKNIIKGDKHEAVVNGVFDIVGVFLPGAKGGIKGFKLGGGAIKKGLGFLKGFANAAIKGSNPIGGIYDSASGLFKLGQTAFRPITPGGLFSFKDKLRMPGRSGNYDFSKIDYKQTIADGTYRPLGKDGSAVPAVAVKRGNHWYGFDLRQSKHYGPPLKDFEPITVKELNDLRYNIGDSIKIVDDKVEKVNEYQVASAKPVPVQQPVGV